MFLQGSAKAVHAMDKDNMNLPKNVFFPNMQAKIKCLCKFSLYKRKSAKMYDCSLLTKCLRKGIFLARKHLCIHLVCIYLSCWVLLLYSIRIQYDFPTHVTHNLLCFLLGNTLFSVWKCVGFIRGMIKELWSPSP